MSVLLYLLGIVFVAGGAAAIGFGIPVKEFSFGDTLIVAGTLGVVGGLIVIGLAAVVSHLIKMGEMLGARPLSKAGRMEPFEAPAKIPFPPKPKKEPRDAPAIEAPAVAAPVSVAPIAEEPQREPSFAAPSLRNPDVPLMGEEEARELPLSPRESETREPEREDFAPEPPPERNEQQSFESAWRPPPRQSEYFDKMWPAAERTPLPPKQEAPSWSENIPRAPSQDRSPAPEPQAEPEYEPRQAFAPREEAPPEHTPVAVLKSGVVDGMGYTLYVDGSIEAELPDGTLRFASINELREHLEQNSGG